MSKFVGFVVVLSRFLLISLFLTCQTSIMSARLGTTPQRPGLTACGEDAARPLVYTSPSDNEIQPTVSQEACPTLECAGGGTLLSRVDSGLRVQNPVGRRSLIIIAGWRPKAPVIAKPCLRGGKWARRALYGGPGGAQQGPQGPEANPPQLQR